MIDKQNLKLFLDQKADQYNSSDFILDDPIIVPHQYSRNQDIELSGFFAATLAWGQRKTIIKSATRLMRWMDNAPYDFVMNATEADLAHFYQFKHRTFSGADCVYFIQSLQHIYKNHGGLSAVFKVGFSQQSSVHEAIIYFRTVFFELAGASRTQKHVSNPAKGSASKRLNLFLRWMVRNDQKGVDFGIWDFIPTSELLIPLDIHSGRVGRELGLLHRKQNDWQAVIELTNQLKQFDANDPVKYDFALFGTGVNQHMDEL